MDNLASGAVRYFEGLRLWLSELGLDLAPHPRSLVEPTREPAQPGLTILHLWPSGLTPIPTRHCFADNDGNDPSIRAAWKSVLILGPKKFHISAAAMNSNEGVLGSTLGKFNFLTCSPLGEGRGPIQPCTHTIATRLSIFNRDSSNKPPLYHI